MSDDGCTRRTRGLRVSGSSPKCVISLRGISWLASLEMEARSRPVLPMWKIIIEKSQEGTSSESQSFLVFSRHFFQFLHFLWFLSNSLPYHKSLPENIYPQFLQCESAPFFTSRGERFCSLQSLAEGHLSLCTHYQPTPTHECSQPSARRMQRE